MWEAYAKAELQLDGYRVLLLKKQNLLPLQNDTRWMPAWDSVAQTACAVDGLSLGLVYVPRHTKRYQWLPVLLYRFDSEWELVGYRESWKCKACGYTTGPVLLHQLFYDPFYTAEECLHIQERVRQHFPIARCPKCNAVLQGNPRFL